MLNEMIINVTFKVTKSMIDNTNFYNKEDYDKVFTNQLSVDPTIFKFDKFKMLDHVISLEIDLVSTLNTILKGLEISNKLCQGDILDVTNEILLIKQLLSGVSK